MIDPGEYLEISYPVDTHVRRFDVVPRRRRHITIHRVRDLVSDPLTVEEFLRRPFVRRSRWLAFAKDNELEQWRQFYLGSTEEFASPGNLRLALYEPGGSRPKEILGREFRPTVFDRKLMMRLLRRWNHQDHGDLQLRICCDDLRLVS